MWSWLPANFELASLRVWSNWRPPVGLSPFGSGRTVAKRGSGSASREGQAKDSASGVPALPEIVTYRMRSRLPRASPRWRGSRARSIWSSARVHLLRADGRGQEALEDATELVPGRSACRRWRRAARHERRELSGDRRDLAPLLDDGVELAGHFRDPSLHDRPRRLGVIDGKVRDPLERVDVEDGCRAHRGIAQLVETQLLGADGIDDARVLAAVPAPLDEQRGDPDERAPGSQRVPRQHRKVGRARQRRGRQLLRESAGESVETLAVAPTGLGRELDRGNALRDVVPGCREQVDEARGVELGRDHGARLAGGRRRGRRRDRREQPVAIGELLLDTLVVGFDGLQVVEQRLGAQRSDGRADHVERTGTVRGELTANFQRLLRRGRVRHAGARVQVQQQAVGGTVGGCAPDRAGRLADRHVVGDATVEEQERIRPGGPEVDVTDELIGLDAERLERHREGRGRARRRAPAHRPRRVRTR